MTSFGRSSFSRMVSRDTPQKGEKSLDGTGRIKLDTLKELPKSLYATKIAVTAYPTSRRMRKGIFNHIEVYKMVEGIANKLRESGVRPGTVCAIALPNSLEAIVYFFALQWIGAIAAPLESTTDENELCSALRAVKAQNLVSPLVDSDERSTDALYLASKAATEAAGISNWHIYRTINEGVLLEVGGQFMGSAAWAGGAGDFVLDPDEVAAHISSPSGVVPLSHRVLTASAKSFVSTYNLAVNTSTVLLPPLHSIHGILILISTFYSGGHVVLPGTTSFDGEKIWELAKKHNVSWLSASRDDIMELHGTRPNRAQRLNFVRSCDGCLDADVAAAMTEVFDAPILESYGTPETAGFATSNTEDDVKLGSTGRAVEGVEIAVFDSESRQIIERGVDVEGEIAVCGENIAAGYLSPDASTAATYYSTGDTSGDHSDQKMWLATGDLGKVDREGFLVVLDRSAVMAARKEAVIAEAEAAKPNEDAVVDSGGVEGNTIETESASANDSPTAAETASSGVEARSATFASLGVQNPDEIDDTTAEAIIARLAAIEENQSRIERDLAAQHAAELEDLRARLKEAEAAAERPQSTRRAVDDSGALDVMDVRMDELEAAVLAAAASAEVSAKNTRDAAVTAREIAESAYGRSTNHSREVALTAATGDQGSLTKTVRVALDDVEGAMRSHPAVLHARAFGRKDQRFGAEVFCAIVPKKGARVSEPWLKLHAQSVLPAPMVPKKFYYVDDMPMNMSRRELADSDLLKDLSAFSGYSEIKHVKGPAFRTAQQVRPKGARTMYG